MPTTNERGHTVPLPTGEAPTRASIFGALDTVNDVILVDDVTDRAAKLAGLSYTPSAARPMVVARADAPAGSELEVTTDGGVTWRTLRTADPVPGLGEYVKSSAALDGSLAPVLFDTITAALDGVNYSAGGFTIATPGVYAVTIRVTSDDGTPDTGHEARLKRGTTIIGRARAFAPAGAPGLGRVITPITWVGSIRDGAVLTLEIDSLGAGGRSTVSAHMYIERLTY